MKRVVMAVAAAVLLGGDAGAQVNARKVTAAEQGFLDRLAAEFPKILPPVPAGWTEVERRIYDAGGMTSDWDAPIQADYSWYIVVSDIEVRRKAVDQRLEAEAERNREAFEANTARNEKLMEEFSAKLQAAIAKNDQAAVTRLQAEFEKKMAAGKPAEPAPPPELSDADATIRISINPYSAPVLDEKPLPIPPGFAWAGRRQPAPSSSDREGVSRYLIGKWVANTVGSGHTLKFTPNKGAVVYGIVVEIEARADRADALFRAMGLARLKALLQ